MVTIQDFAAAIESDPLDGMPVVALADWLDEGGSGIQPRRVCESGGGYYQPPPDAWEVEWTIGDRGWEVTVPDDPGRAMVARKLVLKPGRPAYGRRWYDDDDSGGWEVTGDRYYRGTGQAGHVVPEWVWLVAALLVTRDDPVRRAELIRPVDRD